MRTLLAILSFFVPIIGVIVFAVRKNEETDPGIYLGCAAAGFAFNLIISFLML